ncbi:MAG: hypothetical protein QNJ72_40580 [Pleurocapsa sp. MO_226.B13]|nr:hypothetical protein [Pleurocapsa sp. MO_226.B13]
MTMYEEVASRFLYVLTQIRNAIPEKPRSQQPLVQLTPAQLEAIALWRN